MTKWCLYNTQFLHIFYTLFDKISTMNSRCAAFITTRIFCANADQLQLETFTFTASAGGTVSPAASAPRWSDGACALAPLSAVTSPLAGAPFQGAPPLPRQSPAAAKSRTVPARPRYADIVQRSAGSTPAAHLLSKSPPEARRGCFSKCLTPLPAGAAW
jgi:hypothetical protein